MAKLVVEISMNKLNWLHFWVAIRVFKLLWPLWSIIIRFNAFKELNSIFRFLHSCFDFIRTSRETLSWHRFPFSYVNLDDDGLWTNANHFWLCSFIWFDFFLKNFEKINFRTILFDDNSCDLSGNFIHRFHSQYSSTGESPQKFQRFMRRNFRKCILVQFRQLSLISSFIRLPIG